MSTRTHVLVLLLGTALVVVQSPPGAAPTYSPWSTPVSLGSVVNSPYDDALAAISKDELSLYFTSNRPVAEGGVGAYDIWVSQRSSTDAPWGTPVCLDLPVNTTTNEAGPALSRDGHWLFFHRTTEGANFDLMASWRQHTDDDFGWEEPFNLGPNVNTEFADAGPSFFEGDDGSPAELYFGSMRLGGWDLFVSQLQGDGTFGPAELVAELNSSAADQRPSISHDGREMYFHSNRTGSAVADIWVSTRPSVLDPWTEPTNVTEVNTTYADAQPTLSPKGKMLVFNSNRPGTIGSHDLFFATRGK